MESHGTPWNLVEGHGTLWKNHGTLWNFMESSGKVLEDYVSMSYMDMECHGM
jgi:hypothetical protein